MINQKYFLFGFFFGVVILQNAVFAQNDLVKNINVNTYNIFGNDTIDDSYAFRNLIQTIDEPCVFYFPAGTYIFSNIGEDSSASSVKKTGIAPYLIIRIKSNTTLKGDGAGKSFILIKGQHNTDKLQPTDFAEFSIYTGSNNIHFNNLTIKGDITESEYKYNGRTQNSAIYFFYNGSHKVKTTNCSISNCTFENLAGFVANGECRN